MDGRDTSVASMTSLSDGTFLMTRRGRRTRRTRKTFRFPPKPPPAERSAAASKEIATMNPSRVFQPSLKYAFGPLVAV
jgi:hypothetical protein